MTNAAPSQCRRQNGDACFAGRETMRTADHACGQINFVAVQCGDKVAYVPRETTDEVSPTDASSS